MSHDVSKLTISVFLKKSSSKAALNAEEFLLEDYYEYLMSDAITGSADILDTLATELGEIPIDEREKREELATQALRQIQSIGITVGLQQAAIRGVRQAGNKLQEDDAKKRVKKNYGAQVFAKDGSALTEVNTQGEEVELTKDFLLPQRAEDWACKKLSDAPPGSFALIMWHKSERVIKTIARDEALGKVFKAPGSPACRTVSSKSGLSLVQATVKNYVPHFSHG